MPKAFEGLKKVSLLLALYSPTLFYDWSNNDQISKNYNALCRNLFFAERAFFIANMPNMVDKARFNIVV